MYLRITKTGGQNLVEGQVVLGGVVSNSSVLTGLVVVTEIGYNGFAAVWVARTDIACFEKSLEVTGVDGNAKGILVPGRTISAVGTLSPRTFLIKYFYAKLCKELGGGSCFPAVHEDVATGEGLIQKAIVVVVVFACIGGGVQQYGTVPLLAHFKARIGIAFESPRRTYKAIEEKCIGSGRGFVLHIDLSRERLISVGNRGGTLRYLNGFHPGARHKIQAVGRAQSTTRWHVFGEHLYIGTR